MSQKKFGFVMPSYKTEPTILKRAIDSILDQKDYENWKLIVVFDGVHEEGFKVMEGYTDPRITYKTIAHAGACAARNAGAEEMLKDSEVAYLSFFSSDFIAHPGMISTWAREFDADPEAGMVYGGYDLIKDGEIAGSFGSEEFDPIQLEAHNYIDGGFPVKRECYQPWDVDCKSLNDWEWVLRLVRSGMKCRFMAERTYSAEMPKAGGLSYDSSKNWVERVSYIKTKLGIPKKDVCFCSFGAPFHAKRMARLTGMDYLPNPAFKAHEYKMIYMMGFYSLNTVQAFGGSGMNAIKAIHWIGSDVLEWRKWPMLQVDMAKHLIMHKIDYSLSEYPYTKWELGNLNLDKPSPMIPCPVDIPKEKFPLPEEFTVGIYMPEGPQYVIKYHQDLVRAVVRACPDIKFVLFGGMKGQHDNVEGMGWCNTQDAIKKCSLLLRLAEHDGLPVSAVEFMLHNRQVLTNTPLPYAEIYNTYLPYYMSDIAQETIVDHKDKLIERIRRLKKGYGSLTYDWAKIETFYKDFCSVDRFKENLELMLDRKPVIEPVVDDFYYENGSLLPGLAELSKGGNYGKN
jgi:glycosyltransferase involved in cell wall biosynthesis